MDQLFVSFPLNKRFITKLDVPIVGKRLWQIDGQISLITPLWNHFEAS